MTKEQYLFLLRTELSKVLSGEELEDILRYYEEYFAEAGPEREGEVMAELGTPQRLAEKILGRLTDEGPIPAPEGGSVGGNAQSGAREGMSKGLLLFLTVFGCIVAVPAACGIVLGLGLGGVVCIVTGVGLAVNGLFWGGLAAKLFTVGGGLVTLAVGIVLLLGAVMVCWAAVKAVSLLRQNFAKGENQE